MRPAAAATLACFPLAVLAGCGSTVIDNGKVEALLVGSIQPAPRSVSCPKHVAVRPGRSFTCALVAADGRRYAVTVHMLDRGGHVRVGAADLRPQ